MSNDIPAEFCDLDYYEIHDLASSLIKSLEVDIDAYIERKCYNKVISDLYPDITNNLEYLNIVCGVITGLGLNINENLAPKEISLNISSKQIAAKTRKLKTRWTVSPDQNITRIHEFDITKQIENDYNVDTAIDLNYGLIKKTRKLIADGERNEEAK